MVGLEGVGKSRSLGCWGIQLSEVPGHLCTEHRAIEHLKTRESLRRR